MDDHNCEFCDCKFEKKTRLQQHVKTERYNKFDFYMSLDELFAKFHSNNNRKNPHPTTPGENAKECCHNNIFEQNHIKKCNTVYPSFLTSKSRVKR